MLRSYFLCLGIFLDGAMDNQNFGPFFGLFRGFVGDGVKLPSFFGGDYSNKLMKLN